MNAKEAAKLADKDQLERLINSILSMAKSGHRYAAFSFKITDENYEILINDGYSVERSNEYVKITW